MTDNGLRSEVLRRHGASTPQVRELLAHTRNRFRTASLPRQFPLADEPFVAAWEQYAREASLRGAAATLQQHLVQLRFPIGARVGTTVAYHDAVRNGELPAAGTIDGGVRFRNPGGMRVFLHATAAGRIPVVTAEDRADFIALVRALARRNRPDPVPDAIGAMMISGYRNRSRARALPERSGRAGPGAAPVSLCSVADSGGFDRDRFILLSTGPYSGVAASAVGMPEAAWLRCSLRIRLEHECAHYFTRRVFNHMANSLHDEVIADFIGITAALGRFRADLLLRFMGLERHPAIRATGRLHHYRGTPPLSTGSFAVLAALLVSAAANLEAWHGAMPAWTNLTARARTIAALCRLSLEELAAEDAKERIRLVMMSQTTGGARVHDDERDRD